jgi:hypothetical protein
MTYNVGVLIETSVLYFYFYLVFTKALFKRLVQLTSIVFLGCWFLLFLTKGSLHYYDLCTNIQNISILIFIALFLYEQVIVINTPFINKDPNFWIVSAYFIYFSGIFFMYVYLDTLNSTEKANYYALEYVFIIFRSILLSIAMIVSSSSDTFKNSFNVRQKNLQ